MDLIADDVDIVVRIVNGDASPFGSPGADIEILNNLIIPTGTQYAHVTGTGSS
jgi:hypothetical protein